MCGEALDIVWVGCGDGMDVDRGRKDRESEAGREELELWRLEEERGPYAWLVVRIK
jgi:hypothetical protein